jgi:hypothetical protein
MRPGGHLDSLFVSGAMLLCAVMVVVNLLLVKRRGLSGYLLACAFLAFGATLYAYRTGQSTTVLSAGALVVGLLLAADFYYRLGRTK